MKNLISSQLHSFTASQLHSFTARFLSSLFLITMLIFSIEGFSQQKLEINLQGGTSILTGESAQIYQRFVSSGSADSPKIVLLKPNNQVLEPDGTMLLELPSDPVPAKLKRSYVAENQYGILVETFQSETKDVTYIHLQKSGYRMGYLLDRTNNTYIFSPLDAQKHIMYKDKATSVTECGVNGNKNFDEDPPICPNGQDEACPALITVLFLVPPDGRDHVNSFFPGYGNSPNAYSWGLGFYMSLQQEVMRIILQNSNIKNKTFVYSYKFIPSFDYANPTNSTNDINNLKDLYGMAYRQQHNADLLFLLTSHNYGTLAGKIIGDDVPEVFPAPEVAYGMVSLNSVASIFTMHHEIGHLMGCRHNWFANVGNDNTHVCQHARLVFNPISPGGPSCYNTVMAQRFPAPLPPNSIMFNEEDLADELEYSMVQNPIPYFSDPDILYNYFPTGKPDNYQYPSNNARQIRNTACIVANYVVSNDFYAYINAENCNLKAAISAPLPPQLGQPPYYINWYVNKHGNPDEWADPWVYVGSGQVIDMQLINAQVSSYFWTKCHISSADGGITTNIYENLTGNPCLPFAGGGFDRSFQIEGAISPNPVAMGDFLNINRMQLNVDFSEELDYQIIHSTGKIIKLGRLEKAVNSIKIDESFQSGQYFIVFSPPNGNIRPISLSLSIISKY